MRDLIARLRAWYGRVEAKVKASGLWTLLASVAIVALTNVQTSAEVLAAIPPWARFLLLALAPPLASAIAGYRARHTARPDLRDTGPGDA